MTTTLTVRTNDLGAVIKKVLITDTDFITKVLLDAYASIPDHNKPIITAHTPKQFIESMAINLYTALKSEFKERMYTRLLFSIGRVLKVKWSWEKAINKCIEQLTDIYCEMIVTLNEDTLNVSIETVLNKDCICTWSVKTPVHRYHGSIEVIVKEMKIITDRFCEHVELSEV